MLDKLSKLKQINPVKKALPTKTDEKMLVGLDIGTEFVKAVIARVNGDELEVVGVGRARQALSDMQSGAVSDIAGVVANCEKALRDRKSVV